MPRFVPPIIDYDASDTDDIFHLLTSLDDADNKEGGQQHSTIKDGFITSSNNNSLYYQPKKCTSRKQADNNEAVKDVMEVNQVSMLVVTKKHDGTTTNNADDNDGSSAKKRVSWSESLIDTSVSTATRLDDNSLSSLEDSYRDNHDGQLYTANDYSSISLDELLGKYTEKSKERRMRRKSSDDVALAARRGGDGVSSSSRRRLQSLATPTPRQGDDIASRIRGNYARLRNNIEQLENESANK